MWWLVGFALVATMLLVYPLRKQGVISAALLVLISVAVGTAYWYWGAFTPWQQFVHQQHDLARAKAVLQTIKDPQVLIDTFKKRLSDKPESAKGWYLLGRLYSSQGQVDQALTAFAKAYHFQPGEEAYAVHYAYALWQVNNQVFTPVIKEVLATLLKNNPQQPDSLAMLAMDAYRGHHYQQAIAYWQTLLQITPPTTKEADTIRKAIAKATKRLTRSRVTS